MWHRDHRRRDRIDYEHTRFSCSHSTIAMLVSALLPGSNLQKVRKSNIWWQVLSKESCLKIVLIRFSAFDLCWPWASSKFQWVLVPMTLDVQNEAKLHLSFTFSYCVNKVIRLWSLFDSNDLWPKLQSFKLLQIAWQYFSGKGMAFSLFSSTKF